MALLSYSAWCATLGAAIAKHGTAIAFGPLVYDAWKSGMSADDFAKAQPKTLAEALAAACTYEGRTPRLDSELGRKAAAIQAQTQG